MENADKTTGEKPGNLKCFSSRSDRFFLQPFVSSVGGSDEMYPTG
jgi:hypothetical protein